MSRLVRKQHRTTLKANALNQIRKAIVSRRLRQGDRIVETHLAQQMGISKFPIREAIRNLEKEGLIVTIPFKGAYVSSFDERDLEELYTLRSALEELAIRILMDRINDGKIKKFNSILTKMKKAARERNVEKMISEDMTFHRTICEFSGHRKLLELWSTLEYQIRSFIALEEYTYERVQQLVETHHPVLEAIKSGDKHLAEKRMRDHLSEAMNNIKNAFKETSKPQRKNSLKHHKGATI